MISMCILCWRDGVPSINIPPIDGTPECLRCAPSQERSIALMAAKNDYDKTWFVYIAKLVSTHRHLVPPIAEGPSSAAEPNVAALPLDPKRGNRQNGRS